MRIVDAYCTSTAMTFLRPSQRTCCQDKNVLDATVNGTVLVLPKPCT